MDDNAEEDCFRRDPNDSDCVGQVAGLVFGGLGGLAGGIVGAIVGSSRSGEHWETVPLEKVRMSRLR